ncbi:MAG: hypothetical protein ACM3P0_19790 [Acidobacteriota bacterium]
MNDPRSKSKQVMSMGMFILSSALIIVSVVINYYKTGKMNWVLLFAAVAINGVGIVRTVRLYREKKADENQEK